MLAMAALPKTFRGPGLIDLQVNGYGGFDFNGDPSAWTAEALHGVRVRLRRRGVRAALPTLITDDAAAMIARASRYAQLIAGDGELASCFPALHIEGPFISADDGPRGAHPLRHCLRPVDAPDLVDRIRSAARGRVAIVTLAPELDGAIDLVARLVGLGICPAIGHSDADRAAIARAVDAGARLATHLGNGCRPLLDRLDNPIQSQLADDRLRASFIADGHHMPLATLKNFIRAKTPAASLLVSDAIAAAEMPPGEYRLGGRAVRVSEGGRCSQDDGPLLAGSTLTLDRAVINAALYCDVSFEQAWAMASTQPAALLGWPAAETVTVEIAEAGFVAR